MKELQALCKGSVYVTINGHRTYHTDIATYLYELRNPEEQDQKLIREIIAHDNLVEIQAYPDTPIGFYTVLHHDFDEAVKRMKAIILEARQ